MSEYQHYRDLAFLCTVFDLTDKGNRSVSIDEVREKIEKIFPEEKNFSDLLQRSEFMGSILAKDNSNITITEVGVETAQQHCNAIKRSIAAR